MTHAQPFDLQVLDQWQSAFRLVEDTHPITTKHAARVMGAQAHLPLSAVRAATHAQLEQERAAGLVCGVRP